MSNNTTKALVKSDKKLIWIFTALLTPLFLFVSYKTLYAPVKIVPMGYLCLFLGLITQYYRLVNLDKFLYTLLGAFAVSLIVFVAMLGGTPALKLYEGWAVLFFVGVCFLVVVLNIKNLLPYINEGVVLFQTVVLIYWIINQKTIELNWFTICFGISGTFLTIYTLYHAYSLDEHTTTTKLALSIWSCIIIGTLGIDNFTQIAPKLYALESMQNDFDSCVLATQLFLTGISLLYISGSILMVFCLIPFDDGKMPKKEVKKGRKELKQLHEKRVGDQQVRGYHIIIMVTFTGAIFSINYYYQLLPYNFIIWCVFVTFPILMYSFEKIVPAIGYSKEAASMENTFFNNYKRFK